LHSKNGASLKGFSGTSVKYPLEGDLTHSEAGKIYAQMVDRIVKRMSGSGTILVTSAGAGEGKTVTAANLALAFHAQRIPVLLVELSLMKPKFGEVFGESPLQKGVEDVVYGRTDLRSVTCVLQDNKLSLAMVRQPQNDEEGLKPSSALDQLIADARRDYRWTIFDGPSIDASVNTCMLIEKIGLAVMVARAGRTNKESFRTAYARMRKYRPMVLLNDLR
jgi:Mrp family chromosome partitioning ATPase